MSLFELKYGSIRSIGCLLRNNLISRTAEIAKNLGSREYQLSSRIEPKILLYRGRLNYIRRWCMAKYVGNAFCG